jgi:small subunit ribosomal protein S18
MDRKNKKKSKGNRDRAHNMPKVKITGGIDYKDLDLLKKFISENGKIIPSRVSSTSNYEQRKLSTEIKRARFLSLIPYTDRHY